MMKKQYNDAPDPGTDSSENSSDEKSAPLNGQGTLKSQNMETKTKGWNVFRDPRPITDSGSMTNRSFLELTLRVIKVLVYLMVFLTVLGSSVIAKGTILLMVSQLRSDRTILYCNRLLGTEKTFVAILSDEERITWIWCIILAFAIPEVYTLFCSLKVCLFNKWKKPKVNYFVLVAVMETFHVIGLALMFTSILPDLDVIQGAMLTNCVCFVPGLLMLLSRTKNQNEWKRFILITVDIVALATQATAFVVYPLMNTSNTSLWLLIVALILVSCGWWENYVSVHNSLVLISNLSYVKEKMKSTKHFTYIFVSIWRIIAFFSSSVIFLHLKGNAVTELFTNFGNAFDEHNITVSEMQSTISSEMTPNLSDILPNKVTVIETTDFTTPIYILAIQILSAYLAYISGKFACKILIQQFSFALPINLTVPVSISLLIAACTLRNRDPCVFHGFIPDYLFYSSPNFSIFSDFITQEYAWVWLLWLLSQTWITLHIWTPKCERLASMNNLFVAPTYDGILIDQYLALNRNCNDQPGIIVEDTEEETNYNKEETSFEQSNNLAKPQSNIRKSDLITKIYACATMWHETKDEMLNFLKSILRLDLDQCARKNAQKYLKIVDPDYYEFETHIFFDDAFEMSDHNYRESQLNCFIKLFINLVNEAVFDVHNTQMDVPAPKKCLTPYGGRLIWTLPGNTKMIVHLKDKRKVRHRKRWSQVMYMYYLLGHKIMDMAINVDRKEVIAENTYLLTLDGDIDFQPSAVKRLVDLMKKNKSLGAACGRIHPVGSGPMVWYQMFEYAITHWLQKATEHVTGCVIYSPGCFSLLRGKALMDDNVMKRYTADSSEARHYVQYDQGEDRWLCTLLLQRGYRIEYSAASDAYTHAPESFKELYYQRRRWVPSTMANLMDLLINYERTVKKNHNISLLYICYQLLLMAGTILGPGTIFLILMGAFIVAFKISIWLSFYLNLIPVVLFIIVCFTCRSKIQLHTAAVISVLYGLAMMTVIISIFIQMFEQSWLSPTSLFLLIVTGLLVIAGLMHPQELICLPCGIIYYLTIPSIYMILVIYSIINLNNIAWGTREMKTKKIFAELEEEEKEAEEAELNNKQKLLERILRIREKNNVPLELSCISFNCAVNNQEYEQSEMEQQLVAVLESMEKMMTRLDTVEKIGDTKAPLPEVKKLSITESPINQGPIKPVEMNLIIEDEQDSETESSMSGATNHHISPYWFDEGEFKQLEVDYISPQEERFWEDLIQEYLFPIERDKYVKASMASDLRSFRNVNAFGFIMLNALFVLSIFLLELNQDDLQIQWPFGANTSISFDVSCQEVHITNVYLQLEPIGLVLFLFFIPILTIQFIAMLFHRFGTFAHILASTELNCCGKGEDLTGKLTLHSEDAVEIVKNLQRLDNVENDFVDNTSTKLVRRKTIQNLEMSRRKTQVVYSNLDASFRARFFSLSEGTKLLRNTSMRRSSTAFKTFEERRNTVIAEMKRSQDDTIAGSEMSKVAEDREGLQPGLSKKSQIVGAVTSPLSTEVTPIDLIHKVDQNHFDTKSGFTNNTQLANEDLCIASDTLEPAEPHSGQRVFTEINI